MHPPAPQPNKHNEMPNGSERKQTGSFGARNKTDKNLPFLILGMFAAGIFLMAWGGYEIKGSSESRSWPRTQGSISSSEVSKRTTRDSNHRTRTTYYPTVVYQYKVQGRSYTGNRIEFGGESGGSMKWARKIVDKYPSGKRVDVYYNPQDLTYGVLEAGFTWSSLLIFLAGIVFVAVGVLGMKAYLKNRRKMDSI